VGYAATASGFVLAWLFIDIASVTATRQEGLKATIRKRVRAIRALPTAKQVAACYMCHCDSEWL